MLRFPASAAVLLALTLAACSSDKPAPTCPAAQKVPDAGRLVAFKDGEQKPANVRFVSRVAGMKLTCRRIERDAGKALGAEMKVRFVTEKGPALKDPKVAFRYFVAVVDGKGDVAGRKAFKVNVDLSGAATRARTTETLAPTVPLPSGKAGRYTIYVGFELSKDQLRFNRNNPS